MRCRRAVGLQLFEEQLRIAGKAGEEFWGRYSPTSGSSGRSTSLVGGIEVAVGRTPPTGRPRVGDIEAPSLSNADTASTRHALPTYSPGGHCPIIITGPQRWSERVLR